MQQRQEGDAVRSLVTSPPFRMPVKQAHHPADGDDWNGLPAVSEGKAHDHTRLDNGRGDQITTFFGTLMVIPRLMPLGGRMGITGFFMMTVPVLGCRNVAIPVLGAIAMRPTKMALMRIASVILLDCGFTTAGVMVMF